MSANVFPQMESRNWFEAWAQAHASAARTSAQPASNPAPRPVQPQTTAAEPQGPEDWTNQCLFDCYN